MDGGLVGPSRTGISPAHCDVDCAVDLFITSSYQEALSLANIEIEEFFTRRYGYGVATIIFIVLAGALFLKIRGLGKE